MAVIMDHRSNAYHQYLYSVKLKCEIWVILNNLYIYIFVQFYKLCTFYGYCVIELIGKSRGRYYHNIPLFLHVYSRCS